MIMRKRTIYIQIGVAKKKKVGRSERKNLVFVARGIGNRARIDELLYLTEDCVEIVGINDVAFKSKAKRRLDGAD